MSILVHVSSTHCNNVHVHLAYASSIALGDAAMNVWTDIQ